MSDEQDTPQGGAGRADLPPDDPLAKVTPLRPRQGARVERDAPGQPQREPDHAPDGPEGPDAPDDAMRALLERAAGLPLNDFGNGQRFVTHFGRDCMYVPRVGWFTWSGQVWVADDDMMAVRRRVQRLSDLILREIPHLPVGRADAALLAQRDDLMPRRLALEAVAPSERSDDQKAELAEVREKLTAVAEAEKSLKDRRSRHRSFATTTGNSARMENALREAQVDLGVAYEDLDARPLEVACESGVLRFVVDDMREHGAGRVARVELVAHAREQRITKLMPVPYEPDATAPRWHAFLERVQPDREMREFLKRWAGLSMSAVLIQRMAFFYGTGANGKSVFVDTLARVMGGYAATARIESLTGTNRRGGSEATPDLIPLMNARFVRTSEPDEGQRLQEGLIKELTGGEPILMRQLHESFLEVRPVFKLTMSGNHKPEIRGTDDGIWRRVMLVPFDVQIPEGERDLELVEKLFAERAGILNWMVEGLLEYLEVGLDPPEAVLEATREYREESDPIGQFLVTCCAVTGDAEDVITSKDLTDAFAYHMIERGMSPWKPATFTRQLSAKARGWRHPHTGKSFAKSKASITQYMGLRLTDAFDRRFRNAPRDQHGRPLGVAPSADGQSPDPDHGF